MAEEPNQEPENEEAEAPEEQPKDTAPKTSLWARCLTRKRLVTLVVVAVVAQVIGLVCYKWVSSGPPKISSPEVSLGVFRFVADKSDVGRISSAEFSLHIALLEHVDQAARRGMELRKRRVQQGVEELLRQAHSGDFDDPNLGELKRQMQEQVNETLGIRAIADVIITDLKLTYSEEQVGSAGDTAESVPWVEKPSS